jgi:hypothetical protein
MERKRKCRGKFVIHRCCCYRTKSLSKLIRIITNKAIKLKKKETAIKKITGCNKSKKVLESFYLRTDVKWESHTQETGREREHTELEILLNIRGAGIV